MRDGASTEAPVGRTAGDQRTASHGAADRTRMAPGAAGIHPRLQRRPRAACGIAGPIPTVVKVVYSPWESARRTDSAEPHISWPQPVAEAGPAGRRGFRTCRFG